jgi:membrane-associated phospholipid phosphatase
VERVTAAYFAYLAIAAIARQKPRPAGMAIVVLLCVFMLGMTGLAPLAYLLIGYWLPAMIVTRPDIEWERALLGFDHKLFGEGGLQRFERRAPRLIVEYLEAAYLLCYAVVPAGYLCLVFAGADDAAINRFWSTVLLAAFGCYGLLPWVPTRAPRAIEPERSTTRSWIRTFNLAVLSRASVQWNTFPSGHTAASMATALAIGAFMPTAGLLFGVVAISIAAGSVVGRYHYAADALTGAALAVIAFLMGTAARGL